MSTNVTPNKSSTIKSIIYNQIDHLRSNQSNKCRRLSCFFSNQFINLLPVLRGHAQVYNLEMFIKNGGGDKYGNDLSSWVMLTRNKELVLVDQFDFNPENKQKGEVVTWTDDHSSLISVLKVFK